MTPEVSICQLCLPNTSFRQDLTLARDAGYTGISLDETKLGDGPDGALLDAFERSELRAAACCARLWSILPMANFPTPSALPERVKIICDGIRRLEPFRPDTVFVATGMPDVAGLSSAAARQVVVAALREIASVARDCGTRLSLEPMTRSGGQMLRDPVAPSIAAALELLADADADDAGIVVDVWHLWDSPRFRADLFDEIDRVTAVQCNDFRPARRWRDRAMPGAGNADVPGIFAVLDRAGFTGWLDLEVFSDELWTLPSEDFFRLGADSIRNCWARRLSP